MTFPLPCFGLALPGGAETSPSWRRSLFGVIFSSFHKDLCLADTLSLVGLPLLGNHIRRLPCSATRLPHRLRQANPFLKKKPRSPRPSLAQLTCGILPLLSTGQADSPEFQAKPDEPSCSCSTLRCNHCILM